jgi:ankyrin repeat protein
MQEGDQPIHIAAAHGHPNVVRALIQEYHVDSLSKAMVFSTVEYLCNMQLSKLGASI